MNKIVLVVLMAFSLSTWAESKTVILDLPTMNCAMCPITVKKALKNVKGVTDADVSYDCLLYTSPSPRDKTVSRMPSSA